MRQVRVGRVTYPSIKAASEATGMHRHTISMYMRDGVYAPRKRPIRVEAYNDRAGISFTMPCVKEMAEVLDVSWLTVRRRLDDGRWIFGKYTVKVRRKA